MSTRGDTTAQRAERADGRVHVAIAGEAERRRGGVQSVLAYWWVTLVMAVTGAFPDNWPVLKARGWLVRWCFKSCGKNFWLASGVRILFPPRVEIGDDVYIAPGCWIQGAGGVKLGDEVMLGPFTCLATSNHEKRNGSYRWAAGRAEPIVLERGSWTGAHVVITAGVRLGTGSAAGAGAVVTADVPPHCTVGGVPARVIRRDPPHAAPPSREAEDGV